MENILQALQKPLYASLIFWGVSMLMAFVALVSKKEIDVWSVAVVVYIAYIICSSFFVVYAPFKWHYFIKTMGCSILYVALSAIGLVALNELLGAKNTHQTSMVFLVIMYHPLCLLFFMLGAWIYNFFKI